MSVINRILLLMEKENINARKLTRDLELSNSSITEWKKGKAKPSIEAVVKIAGYFGVTTDYLLLDEQNGVPDGEEDAHPERSGRTGEKGNGTAADIWMNRQEGGAPDMRDAEGEMRKASGEAQGEALRGSQGYQGYPGYPEDSGYRTGGDSLSGEDRRLLDCYHRLAARDREYIRCKMIVLEREGDIRGES